MRVLGRMRGLLSAPDRLLWAVRVRWLVVSGFLGLAMAAHWLGLLASIVPCASAAGVGVALNAANQWSVRHGHYVFVVTAIAIPVDHLLITYVVMNTGGVHSPFVMMYVVQVLATAMLVDTLVAAASALLAMLLWLAGVGLQLGGVALSETAVSSVSAPLYGAAWAAFLLYCLGLLVYLGGYVSERLRASERELQDKNRCLEAALSSLRQAHVELTASYGRLKRTEAQLVQSEKMRGLGQLVAGVAHELNNPISFVSANVEHLRLHVDRLRQALEAYASLTVSAQERHRIEARRRELRIDQALKELPGLLDDCEEGARRTKAIVSELRAFSQRGNPESWQSADLHRCIRSTLAMLGHRVKGRVAVHCDFGDLPAIQCLPDQLNQVLLNLLTNALDAIGPGAGSIWISTRTSERTDPTGCPQPWVTIAIRDDGVGMSAEVCSRIFDPFFTTKEVGRGTGLGLSVSYGIVERHHGTLEVESALGIGSTFTIALPAKQKALTVSSSVW